ncbi:MAG: hypothetical protein COA79_24060 [Planctomycetota bacterium]|nr:MAG: hypothetical protein COA79_24060 [Planctomycetota bacterium]
MGFHGNLKTMHLGDVFQNILQNRSAGNLKIQTKELGLVNMFFMEGELILFHTKNLEDIQWSRVLLSKNEMTAEEVELIESQGIRGEEELSGIISSQIINDDQAAVHLQQIVEEEIYELFYLTDGEFSFESANEIPAHYQYAELFKKTMFQSNSLMMEAARRSDEQDEDGDVSSNEIYSQCGDKAVANKANLTEDEWRIYDLVDGIRNFSEILRDSGSKRHDVIIVIKHLVELKVIKTSETKDLLDKASHLSSMQEYDAAAKIYRRLIDIEKAVPTHRELLAETFLKLQQKDNAVMQLEIMANEYTQRKDFKKAIAGFNRIMEIDNTKLVVHELIANNYLEMGRKKDAVTEYKHVLQLYVDSGVFEKAKSICTRLLDIDPNDMKVMELMAKTCVNRGEREQAVELWLKMGETYVSREEYEEAADIFRKIIKLEPTHEHAKGMINELMIRMGKARTRQKLSVIILSLILVLVIIFGPIAYLEFESYKELLKLKESNSSILDSIEASSSKKDVDAKVDQIVNRYKAFKVKHKWRFYSNYKVGSFLIVAEELQESKLSEFRGKKEEDKKALEVEFKNLMDRSPNEKVISILQELKKFKARIINDPESKVRVELIDGRIKYFNDIESKAKKKSEEIVELLKENKINEANENGKAILSDYALTSYAEKVQFHVLIASTENDSKLSINKKIISRSLPFIHSYAVNEKVSISISKDGYYDFNLEISKGNIGEVDAELKRKILWTYDIKNPISASPWVKDDFLYLFSRNGKLVSLSVDFKNDSSKEVWSYKMKYPSSDVLSMGCFDDDAIYVGSVDKRIYKFSISAGRPHWEKKFNGSFRSGISISKVSLKQNQKMLFAVSQTSLKSGEILGIIAKTGEKAWTRGVEGTTFTNILSDSSFVFLGTDRNRIHILRAATGSPVKITNNENKSVPLLFKGLGKFKGDLAIFEMDSKKYLLAGCEDQNIYCFDIKNGKTIWNFPTSSPNDSGIFVINNTLYCSSRGGTITSVDIKKSIKNKKAKVNWSTKFKEIKEPTSVFVRKNMLYVGAKSFGGRGKVLAIRSNDGALKWTFDAPKSISSRPIVVNDRIFICCDDGIVYVLKVLK